MAELKFNFVKEALLRCKDAQDKATAAWHQQEPQNTLEVCPIDIENAPAEAGAVFADKYAHSASVPNTQGSGPDIKADPLVALSMAQHLMNFKLWHTEDQARRKDVGDNVIAECKRTIDGFNQLRNNFMEKVDACIVGMCLPYLPQTDSPRYNTESIGAAVDRLSILSLKIYHMREETERTDVDAAHIESCRHKLFTLLEQREDLFTAILELIDDYAAGLKRPRVYYQFKMYNDPRLNPALYKNSAPSR